MGRRRGNFVPEHNETLSQEKPKVQEKLIDELINNTKQKTTVDIKKVEPKKVEPKKVEFNVGDNVKLKSDVKFDVQGRRIHNGLRNYNYRILSIRVDGMLIIECLTHCFTVKPDDVINLEIFK